MNQPASASQRSPNRWIIALAGTWLQLFLGTVYAWSYFQKPLAEAYGWKNTQVAWTFSLAICFLGLAAAVGGKLLPRFGPRRLAAIGGVLFGAGYLLAAAALQCRSIALLYLGYGIVGGTGLGLGYVTPVATVAKWFPDKKGFATGLVIMGFGFGALLMSKVIAPALCQWAGGDLAVVFAWLGVVFAAATLLGAAPLRNPPANFTVGGDSRRRLEAEPSTDRRQESPPTESDRRQESPPTESDRRQESPPTMGLCKESQTPSQENVKLLSPRFAAIWTIFFCNIVAGISIISFQSPIFQDLWRQREPALSPAALASYGAWLIAVTALFNGVGRMFWGALSDRIGRLPSFRLMLGSQLIVFAALPFLRDPWVFGALICYVLLCYGGGFGTMPALILDTFGPARMAAAYGLVLTAWSAGGVVGPQIIAGLTDRFKQQDAASYSFFTSAGFLAVGLLLSLVLRGRKKS